LTKVDITNFKLE